MLTTQRPMSGDYRKGHEAVVGGRLPSIPLAAICEHMYYWVDPTYVKPASSEPNKLHRLDWMKLLSQKLWKPKYDSKTSGDEMTKILNKQKTERRW